MYLHTYTKVYNKTSTKNLFMSEKKWVNLLDLYLTI